MTFSSKCRAYFWSFLSSTPLSWTSWRSRVIWSCGVVVVSPQPGQEEPGHCRQFDGLVCARPTLAVERAACGVVCSRGVNPLWGIYDDMGVFQTMS